MRMMKYCCRAYAILNWLADTLHSISNKKYLQSGCNSAKRRKEASGISLLCLIERQDILLVCKRLPFKRLVAGGCASFLARYSQALCLQSCRHLWHDCRLSVVCHERRPIVAKRQISGKKILTRVISYMS